MKATLCFTIVALTQSVYAGHRSEDISYHESAPYKIRESPKTYRCPNGFKQHGKECIHTVVTKPDVFCPKNFIRHAENQDHCTQFFSKKFECFNGLEHFKGSCISTREVPPLVECPEGYTILHDGNQCARSVRMPNKFICPHGTVQRHDACVKRVPVEPELVCPRGDYSKDGRCKIVEVYDCSPEKVHTDKEGVSHKKHKKLRLLGEKKKHSSVSGKESPFFEEHEFVSEKTCKRVRIESANKVCPKHSLHHHDGCIVEEEVPMVEEHGGFKQELTKANFICPHGHAPSSSGGKYKCLIKEELPLRGFCPLGSEDFGDKCAMFRPLLMRCPSDTTLKSDVCVKTIYTQPIVEFSVGYQCYGKNCEHQLFSAK